MSAKMTHPADAAPLEPVPAGQPCVSWRELILTWGKIGLLSFGGPAGQIALMHRIVVEEKGWLDEARYLGALNFCMLLPGPEAQQLATFVGWRLRGTAGGLVCGLLFILPGLVLMLAMAAAYMLGQGLTGLETLFFGIKAAVLAIILQALLRLAARSLATRTHLVVAIFSFLAITALQLPFPILMLAAGLAGWLFLPPGSAGESAGAGPLNWRGSLSTLLRIGALWLVPLGLVVLVAGPSSVLAEVAGFFATLAVVSFGGAYAALSYLAQAGVGELGWLSASEMIDGLGLAETTPGPLVLVTQFVAFLAGFKSGEGAPLVTGLVAAAVSAWALFVPSFMWIFAFAPHMEALRRSRALSAMLGAVAAAVVGVIASLAFFFAANTLFARQVRHEGVFGDVVLPVLSSAIWQGWALALLAGVLVFALRAGVLAVLGLTVAASFALSLIA